MKIFLPLKYVTFLILFKNTILFGQLSAGFTSASNACLQQNVYLTNTSQNAFRYEWDLCPHDFDSLSTNQPMATISGLSNYGAYAYKLVEDNGLWYGFVAQSSVSGVLYRLDFGNSPLNTPAIVNLGNPGNVLTDPVGIDVYKVGNNWYGFVGVYDSNGGIVRLDFGTSLTNSPSGQNLGMFGLSGRFWDVKVIEENGNLVLVMPLRSASTSIVRVNYRNSFNNPISNSTDVYVSTPNADVVLGSSLDLVQIGNDWVALAVSNSKNTIVQFRFVSSIFSEPTEERVYAGSELNKPFQIKILREGSRYVAAVTNENSILDIVNFFTFSLSTSPAKMAHASLPSLLAISVCKYKDVSVVQGAGLSNTISELVFHSVCDAPYSFTQTVIPFNLKYGVAGTKDIQLRAFDTQDLFSTASAQIIVSSSTAPDITFTSQNICAKNNINFTSTNVSGNISSYAWAFDDGGTSAVANPSYIYTSAGTYLPALTVTASNGCQNIIQDSLRVFNPPQANFLLPPASPFCTNQNYTFANSSIFDAGSSPVWQWNVNGNPVSANQNLNYTLASASAQTISLIASIPGCSTQSTQNISTVLAGPLVSFTSATTGCVASSVSFTNTTSGSVTGYTWVFGDSNTSTQTNITHAYISTGTYIATLNATNAAGCQNSFSKNISIYSNPQPKFSIESPPFSCANYPAQFDNNTGFLSDSNITLWQWNFGDAANGSSSAKSPAYTFSAAGNYNVSLKATTNFGCTATKDSVVAILASPVAGFTNSVACLNQSTQFTSTSTGSIVSYKWYFPGLGSPVTGANPGPQIFTSSGANSVTLAVTATNGCINTFTKSINIPVPPVVDFSIQYPCTRNATVFQELNPGGSDPTVSWNWNFGSATTTGSPATYKFSSSGGYGVTLTTTRQSGCVYSVTKNISIYDGPIASFTPSVIAGAAPLPVTFNNTSTADSYGWQFGDAANSTSTVPSPTFTYSQLGEYKVQLTANNVIGCRDTMSVWISVVIPKPSATLKIFSLIPSSSANSSQPYLSVFNSGNVPLVNPEVDIDLGGGGKVKQTLSGLIQPQGTLSQTLNLQILTGSLSYVCVQIVVPQDVNPDSGKQCLTLQGDMVFEPYPNPASGTINLNWITTSNENIEITLFKSDGTVAFQQSFSNQPAGLTQFSLPTAPLANGLYLIRFSGAVTQKTFRVAITN